jgi:threonine dehydrogenase-like Zn-dependent dehydrogenase
MHGDDVLAASAQLEGLPAGAGVSVDLGADVFMGHEFSAEILDAGPGTEAPPAGTLVTSVPVLLSVPNGLDARHAALTEPMAVGLHAVNKSDITRGETALVIGCGPIGIAIIAALKARGVETIVASDFSAKRRELALAVGAQGAEPNPARRRGGLHAARRGASILRDRQADQRAVRVRL